MKEEKRKLNVHTLFWYFIFFSILGLLIETAFCYITTGVLESRKGLMWGPFCPVYGVGAIILVVILNKYKDKPLKLFIAGALVGGLVEYLLSFVLEGIYSSRFWDYGYLPFNVNGRICLTYNVYWGILAIMLIKYMKPKLDKVLEEFTGKKVFLLEKIILVFLIINTAVTIWGATVYKDRAIDIYYNRQKEENVDLIDKIENDYFSNERMLKTFPNLRVQIEGKSDIFIRDILNREVRDGTI